MGLMDKKRLLAAHVRILILKANFVSARRDFDNAMTECAEAVREFTFAFDEGGREQASNALLQLTPGASSRIDAALRVELEKIAGRNLKVLRAQMRRKGRPGWRHWRAR